LQRHQGFLAAVPECEEKSLTVIRPASPWRFGTVAIRLLLSVTVALALGACSSNSNRGVTGSVGVGTGVALSTPGSVTQIQVNTALVVTASVTADVNSAGVVWTMTGSGTLTDITATTATYNAPVTATGAVDATITATSVVNSASAASVTIVVLGTPVMNVTQLFPANVNVAYGASVSVAGGEANYAWAVSTGSTLPAGLTLSDSATSVASITGTPTTQGTFTFTIQATDALSRVTSQTLTLQVLPADTCLLIGSFSFMVSGFRGGGPMSHTGNITIDSNGNITGVQDYKDGHRVTTDESITSGTCVNRETNSGEITLNAASGPLNYDFSVTPPDANGSINAARLQLIASGADSASGELHRQDITAITPAAPIGNFAFGLITLANQEPGTVHSGSAGRFTSSNAGVISAGLIDSNGTPVLTDAPLTGTLSAPDSHGRGTANLLSGSQALTLVYYMIDATKMYLMDVAPTVGTPRSTGYLTAQVGNLAGGGFDNGALASSTAAILSLYGAVGPTEPLNVMTMGRLYNGDAPAGTVDAVLDVSDHDTDAAGLAYSAQSYSVDSSGRGTLSLNAADASYKLVFYLDGIADGYVIQVGSPAGSAGLLEAQYTPASGSYTDTLSGQFVGGTQFAQVPGPIVLIPSVELSFGSLSSTYSSGQFAVNSSNGRGFGELSLSGVASTSAALYQVSPTKFEIMTFGTIQVDGTILWMIGN
jgi:hypothetical protein